MTLDDAAGLLKMSKSALNRMERAQVVIRPYEVQYLIMMYEVTDPDEREALLGLASGGRSRGWVKRYGDLSPGALVDDLVRLEQDSSAIRVFHPFGIHGLLQTPEYARAVKSSILLDPGQDVDKAVACVRASLHVNDSRECAGMMAVGVRARAGRVGTGRSGV
jgi:hypothetical protein